MLVDLVSIALAKPAPKHENGGTYASVESWNAREDFPERGLPGVRALDRSRSPKPWQEALVFGTTVSGLLNRPMERGDKGLAVSSRSRTASTAGVFFLLTEVSALPVIAWEASFAVYLIVKGFKPSSEQSHTRFPMEGHR